MSKEVFNCHGCGKSSDVPVTPDCICDLDGLEYMTPKAVVVWSRNGYKDRVVDLTGPELGLLESGLMLLQSNASGNEDKWLQIVKLRSLIRRSGSKFCTRCGNYYSDFPALSRVDNKTEICSSCGTDEAIQDFTGEPLSPLDKKEL